MKEDNKWYELGRIEATKKIANDLYDRAAGLFRGHNDKQAIEIRGIANTLILEAKQMREDYNEKYHGDKDERSRTIRP